MTRNKSSVDKNLQNVVDDLEQPNINSLQTQQQQQQTNDRRHQDALNHDEASQTSVLLDKE